MERPYSVSEITRAVRETLEGTFSALWVVGGMMSTMASKPPSPSPVLPPKSVAVRAMVAGPLAVVGVMAER